MAVRVATAVLAGLPLLTTPSCSEIDCPLDNIVVLTCNIYQAEDATSLTLADTLTITAAGTDSILLNRATDINTFQLPMRQGASTDTLILHFSNSRGQSAADSLFVSHTNQPHFESVDCPPSVFHNITSVSWTDHALSQFPLTIDSVAVTRSLVNYDDVENLKIYLRSTAH